MANYDAIIVGAGQSGPPLAYRLAGEGWKVAIVEGKHMGGTCVNVGCTPTKTLVASARAAHMARRGPDFGVTTGSITVDMKKVKARKDAIVTRFRDGVKGWMEDAEGIDVYYGHARFEGPHVVRVNDEVLHGERFFLNVGARPFVPPIDGLDGVDYLNSNTILDLDEVPGHLIVIGGSYIGLEFGQVFRRFGAEVSIIEMASHLIRREDEDTSEAIREIMENEGVHIYTDSECMSVEQRDSHIVVRMKCESGPTSIAGTHLLVATGRTPNTDDLGLEAAGVETTERGYIKVDDELRSNVPHIWAIGDVNGRGAFTHTSYNDYQIVADNVLNNVGRKVTERYVTYALYIDPPLGRVGMTETQARESGHSVLMAKRNMDTIARALERDETQGFVKLLVDAKTEEFLGATILGIGGDEIVHIITDMMYANASYTAMRDAVHIHPTVSELLPTILGSLEPLE